MAQAEPLPLVQEPQPQKVRLQGGGRMSGKTATERLREMLDERGVAHSDHYLSTTWRDGYGILHLAGEPMADGSLVVDMLTPEQAIAATLGNSRADYHGYEQAAIEAWESIKAWNSRAERTCECVAEYAESPIDGKKIILHRCSACHGLMRPHMRHCPNCGARRVGE